MKKNFSDRSTNGAVCFAVNAGAFAGKRIPAGIREAANPLFRLYKNRQLIADTAVSTVPFLLLFLRRKQKAKDAEAIRISFACPVENRKDNERQIPATARKIWKQLRKKESSRNQI